jgi:hypothetical protein
MKNKIMECEYCHNEYSIDFFDDFYDWFNTQFPRNIEIIPTGDQLQLCKDAWNSAVKSTIFTVDNVEGIEDIEYFEKKLLID